MRREKLGVDKLLHHLTQSEATLNNVTQLLIYRNSILTLHAIQFAKPTSTPPQRHAKPAEPTMTSKPRYRLLAVDSFLRKRGFYGYFVFNTRQESWNMRTCMGYNPPAWPNLSTSWLASCGAELSNRTILPSEFGFSVTSAYVRVKNCVSIDSPFMRACRLGDVGLISQSLANGSGRLAGRTMSTGRHPCYSQSREST